MAGNETHNWTAVSEMASDMGIVSFLRAERSTGQTRYRSAQIVEAVFSALICLAALALNILLVVAILRLGRLRRLAVFILIMCTAILDILRMLTIPLVVYVLAYGTFPLGKIACVIYNYLGVVVLTSMPLVLTILVAILAVHYRRSYTTSWLPPGGPVIAFVVSMAFIIFVDLPVATGSYLHKPYCVIPARIASAELGYRLIFLCILFANILVMVISYFRGDRSNMTTGKRRLALILSLIVIYHFVAHFPLIVVNLVGTWGLRALDKIPFIWVAFRIIHLADALVKPILYLSLSRDIQDGIKGRTSPAEDTEMQPVS